jgi:hypothetical protein
MKKNKVLTFFHHLGELLLTIIRSITLAISHFFRDYWDKLVFMFFFTLVFAALGLMTVQLVTPDRGLQYLGVTQLESVIYEEPIDQLRAQIVWVEFQTADELRIGDYVAIADEQQDELYWIEEIIDYNLVTQTFVTSFDGIVAHEISQNRVMGRFMRISHPAESLAYFSTEPFGYACVVIFLFMALMTAYKGLIQSRKGY